MPIAIVTLATPHISRYSQYSFCNKLAYARKHDYDFFSYDFLLDPLRPPAWNKILVIEKHLADYEWIFWTDADSLIMDHSKKLESIVDQVKSRHMIMTPGPRQRYNTGQWFIRSCEWSFVLLRKIWTNVSPTDFWYRDNPWEQQAFVNLIERNPEIAEHIHCVPVRELNSRPDNAYVDVASELSGLDYADGDFIVHFYHTKDFHLRVCGMRDYYMRWSREDDDPRLLGETLDVDRFDGGYKWTRRNPTKRSQ